MYADSACTTIPRRYFSFFCFLFVFAPEVSELKLASITTAVLKSLRFGIV